MFHGVLSESELLLMKYLWDETEKGHSGIVFSDIMAYTQLKLGKPWKKQTVNTFLSRLKTKEFITATPNHGKCTYLPIVRRVDYFRLVVQRIYPAANVDFPDCIMDGVTGLRPLTQDEKEDIIDFIYDEE